MMMRGRLRHGNGIKGGKRTLLYIVVHNMQWEMRGRGSTDMDGWVVSCQSLD